MSATASRLRTAAAFLRREHGFTISELLIVVALLEFTMAMFATTFGTIVNRNSKIRDQNVYMTQVRGTLNQFVTDLRNASYGDITVPISAFSATSITFYSPDRMQPFHLRNITYAVSGNTLTRQVTISTNTNGPPWTWPATAGPVETVFTGIANPSSVFKFCTQTPRDMAVDPSIPSSPDLITWKCSAAATASDVRTVIVKVQITPNTTTTTAGVMYSYEAVATLRWNAGG